MAAMTETTFWILTALSCEPRHGYAILHEVERLSYGAMSLRVTTLYAGLDRLERANLIRATGEEVVEGRARRYYEATPDGRHALSDEVERLAARAKVARVGLAGGGAAASTAVAVA
jgi:DNA-binding PadR family transcriptional regulator